MGRRQARDIYEEEYEADERTRAALAPVASVPSYDDQFEDRTRSARESYVALEGLENRSGERPSARPSAPEARYSHVAASEVARRSFVAPAEIEGERSPAMRARRQSFVEPSELPTPARERRPSHVARSERPGPLPTPPNSGRRNSYVASSERADFASSVPDAEEVTGYREAPPAPARSERRSKHPSQPPVEERSRPVDYEALKQYLFADVHPDSPQAAAMSIEDRSVSMQTPVATLDPRTKGTNKAFRPAMHSIPPQATATPRPASPPEIAPAARISHNAFRPQMMTGPQFPGVAAAAPAGHDSYVDSSWIVPTPQFPSHGAPKETGAFKITFAFIAAALTAFAALTVMIGAIVFMRSEDAPLMPPGPVTDAVKAAEPAKAAQPVAAPVVTEKPAAVQPVVADKKPVVVVADKKPVAAQPAVVAEKVAEKKPVAAKKKAAPPAASDDDEDDEPPPPPKKTAKKTAADKSVEAMLADLQEKQLNH